MANGLPRETKRLRRTVGVSKLLNQIGVGHTRIVRTYGRLSSGTDQKPPQMAYVSIFADMRPFRDRLKEAATHAGVPYGQTAIAKSLGVSKQTVDQWMDKGRPTPEYIYLIADKWRVNPRWLATEQGEMTDGRSAAQQRPLSTREEIAIELFAGLTNLQQKEQIKALRALYDANRLIREQFMDRPLRNVSNEEVEKAFGPVPGPASRKRPQPRRRSGFREEDPE